MKFPEDCGILEAYRTWTKNLKSFEINELHKSKNLTYKWTKNLKSFEIAKYWNDSYYEKEWTKNLKSFEIAVKREENIEII